MRPAGIQMSRFESVLPEFIASIESADNPVVLEAALLRLAHQLVPAYRVELRTGAALSCADEPDATTNRASAGGTDDQSGDGEGRLDQSILDVQLRCGKAVRGRLRIRPRARGVASLRNETIEQLTALCTLSAWALERLEHDQEWPVHDPLAHFDEPAGTDPAAGAAPASATFVNSTQLRDATFLNAVLPFALSQARRHNETISILCVSIDRLGGIQELLGRAAVDRFVLSVGESVAALIRSSDIVARLDDDRVIAVLPRAPGGGAMHVAQRICEVVAAKCHEDCEIPKITVSIGVATFPRCGDNVFSLFDAADEALARAQSQGRNQASLAYRRAPLAPSHIAACPSSPA